MVSFIISVDTTFPMASNFFELFLKEKFVQESEVIVVVDGCSNIHVHNLLKKLCSRNPNLKVYFNDKMGYGIANNFGVKMSTGEYLFFINSDIFTTSSCYEKMLDVLVKKEAECVQPLLLYPQTNTVQCAGTFLDLSLKITSSMGILHMLQLSKKAAIDKRSHQPCMQCLVMCSLSTEDLMNFILIN